MRNPWSKLALAALCVLLALAAPAQESLARSASAVLTAGRILRLAPLPQGGTPGSRAYRLLYRSSDERGRPTSVSGAIFIPAGVAPPGGRPIVAWAHPTTGIADRCAPSFEAGGAGSIAGLDAMLARGWIVVATDYAGLGTPGAHPYLIGESEARSIVDSVRAARALLKGEAGRRFAVWGHSQGGHAALFTGALAARLAPELRLVGIAAAAPPTDLGAVWKQAQSSGTGRTLAAIAISAWSRIFGIPAASIVRDGIRARIAAAGEECFRSLEEILKAGDAGSELGRSFLTADPTRVEPWRSILAANSPKAARIEVPVFIAQGSNDSLVAASVTRRFAARLCAAKKPVRYLELPGGSHFLAGLRSAERAVDWMAGRFAGETPPDDCRHRARGIQPIGGLSPVALVDRLLTGITPLAN